ncbi:MAG: hypothetical protein MUC44_06305 [Beijerinckiaceae bacterium]|jgi:uncharacterized membrane protein|nr:hypothetical protein [Beijerinckiaceae bacterium]
MSDTALDQPIKAAPPDRRSLSLAMRASSGKQLRRLLARGNLARLLHGLALFVALAALAHLLTTLLIPRYARQDAGSLFVVAGAEGRADLIGMDVQAEVAIIDADPFTAIGVCGFDLNDGPLRVRARAGQLPLALSVHVRGGGVFYAVTDKAAQRGIIEFVVLNQVQFDERAARDDDGESIRELRVVSPAPQGIVVARALVRQPSDRQGAEALVRAMACGSAS